MAARHEVVGAELRVDALLAADVDRRSAELDDPPRLGAFDDFQDVTRRSRTSLTSTLTDRGLAG
jgi:hypothetical protein